MDRNMMGMDTVGEKNTCRSCGGRGYKVVSSRRSVRVAEGTYVMRRRPCLDCVGLIPVPTVAGKAGRSLATLMARFHTKPRPSVPVWAVETTAEVETLARANRQIEWAAESTGLLETLRSGLKNLDKPADEPA